jgi:hypothetical protein
MAHYLKNFDFDAYFISSPRCKDLLKYLDAFFRNTTGQFVFFYVGHGHSLRDVDEIDGNDEAFVFDDGVILDDDLVTHVIENKNPSSEIILITDACRPGTIWDLQNGVVRGRQLPPGLLSISTVPDTIIARQAKMDQGIFTENLTRALNADQDATPADIAVKMKAALREYSQTFALGTTSPSLLTQPLFD